MLTTRVQIGKIQATGDSAQGIYWGFDQTAKGSFFGTVGQVRQQFRATQSPQANVQFSDDGSSVFIVVPQVFNLGLFDAGVGISLIGGGVSMWTAAGGFTAIGSGLPLYNATDPALNGRASISFVNGDVAQYLTVPPLLNGNNVFSVEVVATATQNSGPAYDVGNVRIWPVTAISSVNNVRASLGGVAISAVLRATDGFAHTTLFAGDGTTLRLYYDGLLVGSAAQVGGVVAAGGTLGFSIGLGSQYAGKMAQVAIGNQPVTQNQAMASAAANTQKYVPRH